jgi:hypothetical protein
VLYDARPARMPHSVKDTGRSRGALLSITISISSGDNVIEDSDRALSLILRSSIHVNLNSP